MLFRSVGGCSQAKGPRIPVEYWIVRRLDGPTGSGAGATSLEASTASRGPGPPRSPGRCAAYSSVASTLWNMGGNTRTEIASAISRLGARYSEIGSALLTIPNTKLSNVAYALWHGTSASMGNVASVLSIMGNAKSSIAVALWNMGGNTRSEIVNAMSRGLGEIGRAHV